MPLYEYRCNACKAEFEKLVLAGARAKMTCPDCSSADVTKKMSAAGVIGSSQADCSPGSARPGG